MFSGDLPGPIFDIFGFVPVGGAKKRGSEADCRVRGDAGRFAGAGRPVKQQSKRVPRKLYAVEYIKQFVRDEQGQDLVEYSLLLVLVGVASLFAITEMGLSISAIFSKVNTKLTEVKDSMVE